MSSGLRPAEIEIHSSEQTLTDFPTPTSPRSPIHEKHMDHKFVERTFINNIDLEHCAPKHVEQHPKRLLGMGNPAIMGNWAFATIQFLMALHKLILPTRSGNLMFPVALFFGGIVQFLAGILILFNGDSFNGSVFVTYGSYWIGAGTMMVPNVGALFDVYDLANERNLTAAIYMFMWAAFALMITLISVRIKGGSLLGTWCLFFVFLNLFLEGIYDMTLNSAMMRASGVACAMACLGGYYSGIVDLFAEQGSVLWCGKYKSRL